MQAGEPETLPRYCSTCGGIFTDRAGDRCPSCGAAWNPRSFDTTATIAVMLTELRWLREDGLIDQLSYNAARALYERRLASVSANTTSVRLRQSAAADAGALAAHPFAQPQPSLPWRTDDTPAQPAAPRQSLSEWAAARQADILLYLGAFLLTIAALIFIGYQGEALGGSARCLVLLAYTIAFLGLGVLLPRWDRVKEAGPIFLALGAVLVPANFIALRTQILRPGDISEDVLLLLGAGITGALYLLLAVRGYGRLYSAPGALALAVAYGALGSVLRLYPDWFGVWFAGGASVLAASSTRLPARRWVEAGAIAAGGFGLLAAHAVALDSDGTRWQLPLSYALALPGAILLARRGQPAVLAALPALVTILAMTAWWAAFGLEPRWWSIFLAAGGLGYLALAERDAARQGPWRVTAAAVALLALWFAYAPELDSDPGGAWQIPATWLLVLAGAAWETYRGRAVGALLLPAAAGLFAQGILWALDTSLVWWSYPLLGVSLTVLLAEPWWRHRPTLDRLGWPYALLVALVVPVAFIAAYDDNPIHGIVGFGFASLIFVAASLRTRGALARLTDPEPSTRTIGLERQSLALAGVALLYVAAAYLNLALGLAGADRAWVFAGIGVAAWIAAVLVGRRGGMLGIVLPSGVAGLTLAAGLARSEPAAASFILAAGVAGSTAAAVTSRRAPVWLLTTAFALGVIAFVGRWLDLNPAYYPLACAVPAATLTLILTCRRDYATDERAWTVTALSWGVWLFALAAAGALLLVRADGLPAGVSLARTREWAVFAIVLAGVAAAIALEGRRLHQGLVATLGTGGLTLALLLGIAIAQPANVQAYTIPAGLYLLGLGFVWRHSPPLIDPHLNRNEGLQILGMLLLVLPAAEQAWEPGGGRFGLELIGIGLILLATGLALSLRWLVVGAVLTLTGVSLRWLLAESEIPYWLTLGVVGMVLLLLGTLLLLERERWDRLRERVKAWWSGCSSPEQPA